MLSRKRSFSGSDTSMYTTQHQSRSWGRRKHVVLLALTLLLVTNLIIEAFVLTFSVRQPLLAANWQQSSWQTRKTASSLLSVGNLLPQITTLASGVTETSEELLTLVGAQQVSVLHIDLTNPRVHLGVVQSHDQLFSHGEKLTSLANRSGAIAGINSDFFEIHQTGDPLGMLTINGQLWQSPGAYDVLGVTASGQLVMGPESFSGSVISGHETYALSSVNRYGDTGTNHLRLYTPTLGATLPLHGATLAILQPGASSTRTFTVASIRSAAATLPILQGQSALVGRGDAGVWLTAHLHAGDSVSISERVAPDDKLVQAVGGGPIVLKDGVLYHDPQVPAPHAVNARNPLTAIGISKDGKHALFVVCDGREAGSSQSRGFTYAEMANYLLSHSVYQAMIFDSGGSSELVARLPGQSSISVISTPSAGNERLVANGLFVYTTASPSPGGPANGPHAISGV